MWLLVVSLVVLLGCVACEEEEHWTQQRAERYRTKVLGEVYEMTLKDGTRCAVIGDYRAYAAISCNWRGAQ